MSMRITKYPQLGGFGSDLHTVWAGSMPPMPPMLPNPAPIPWYSWLAVIMNLAGASLTGKYTKEKCITEFMSDTLVGHDWGMFQLHIPIPPVVLAPNMPVLTLASSHKYFLPCYSVQETPQGGALSLIGAGATPVAVSLPACCIPLQDCWECIVAPSSVVFNLPTTRWVGFSWGDLFAGLVLLAGDALAARVSSAVLSKVFKLDNLLSSCVGVVLGAVNTAVANFANAKIASGDLGAPAAVLTIVVVYGARIKPDLAVKAAPVIGKAVALLGPAIISVTASQIANWVGDPS